MMFCQKCGAENADDATYCNKCGAAMKAGAVPTPTPIAEEPLTEKDKSTINKCVAIIVAVAILIAGGAGYFYLDNYGNQAYVAVQVYSTHITETVDIQVLYDGEIVYTWSDLEPGDMFYSKTYHSLFFSKFEKSHIATITAISTGGATGTITDVKELIVQPGQKYTVDLYI